MGLMSFVMLSFVLVQFLDCLCFFFLQILHTAHCVVFTQLAFYTFPLG